MNDAPQPIQYELHDKRHVDGFLEECKIWLGPSLRKITSYLAMKVDDKFVLLVAKVRCQTVLTAPESAPVFFESDRLRAGIHVEVIEKTDFSAALRNEIEHAQIVVPSGTYALPRGDGGRISPYRLLFGDANTDNATPRMCGLRVMGQQFTRIEPYAFNNPDINWELKGASIPYYDINDLLGHLGMTNLRTHSEAAFIEMEVVPPAMLSRNQDSSIRGDELIVTVIAQPDIQRDHVSIGILSNGRTIDRLTLEPKFVTWTTTNGLAMGTVKHRIEGIVFTQVFLKYKGQAIDQMVLVNPDRSFNPGAELYKIFDSDRSHLVTYLTGEGPKRAQHFEVGISILLHLHGYRVLHLGKKWHWSSDTSDLIAITPGGNVLIVECTTGLLNNGGKLSKLHARTEEAKAALRAANRPYLQVLPVIVSSKQRQECDGDIAEARRLKIAVICRADIDQAVAEISTTPNPEASFQRLVAMIPQDGNTQYGQFDSPGYTE